MDSHASRLSYRKVHKKLPLVKNLPSKLILELVLTMHEVIAHYNQMDSIGHDEL